jgi:peroxiredoxin Q/BCP
MSLNIGDKAPEFTLQNAQNEKISLKQFLGQWVVLYFYPKDDTPGCTTEACDFSAALPHFDEVQAKVIGISPDSPESHKKFIAKHDLTIDLLSDENKSTIQAYHAWGKKSMYGKEYEGVLRSTFLINPQGTIAAIWPNVSVTGHSQKVQEKLKELIAKK